MEEYAVIVAGLDTLHEIVTVTRGVAVEQHGDVAERCVQKHLDISGPGLGCCSF